MRPWGPQPKHSPQRTQSNALLWRPPFRHVGNIRELSFAELKFDGDPASPAGSDELRRQAGALGAVITRPENLDEFGLVAPNDPRLSDSKCDIPCIQSIRTSRRVGPDGQVVFDLVAEVTQRRLFYDHDTGAPTVFYGGSTIILGPRGEVRYVVSKNVRNEDRLRRQRKFEGTTKFRKAGSKESCQLAHRKGPDER
jgi:hypothetical protein